MFLNHPGHWQQGRDEKQGTSRYFLLIYFKSKGRLFPYILKCSIHCIMTSPIIIVDNIYVNTLEHICVFGPNDCMLLCIIYLLYT